MTKERLFTSSLKRVVKLYGLPDVEEFNVAISGNSKVISNRSALSLL